MAAAAMTSAVVATASRPMTSAVAGTMSTAMTGSVAATVARAVTRMRRSVHWRTVNRGPVDVDVAIHVDVAVVPIMPAGGAPPADPATPRVAAPVPTRPAPSGIVPTIIAATPNELSLFDRRGFDERGRGRERASPNRGLGG